MKKILLGIALVMGLSTSAFADGVDTFSCKFFTRVDSGKPVDISLPQGFNVEISYEFNKPGSQAVYDGHSVYEISSKMPFDDGTAVMVFDLGYMLNSKTIYHQYLRVRADPISAKGAKAFAIGVLDIMNDDTKVTFAGGCEPIIKK